MKLTFKILRVDQYKDELTGEIEEKITETSTELIIKEESLTAVWVEPDYDEMYIYSGDAKFTVDYDRDLYIYIAGILGEIVDPPLRSNGLS